MTIDNQSILIHAAEIKWLLMARVESSYSWRGIRERLLGVLLARCMENDGLRIALFRFVDVSPSLKTEQAIVSHFLSYVGPHAKALPFSIGSVLCLTANPHLIKIAAFVIRRSIRMFASRFIIDSVKENNIIRQNARFAKRGCGATWDILGEEALTREEADESLERYLRLINFLGGLPTAPKYGRNVSVKLSSLTPKAEWDPLCSEKLVPMMSEKLAKLLRAGRECGVSINIDMEQYAARDLTLAIFRHALSLAEFRDLSDVGIVAQAYLHDSEKSLRELLAWIGGRSGRVIIRLVKGAYWDHEMMNAEERGWPVPVFTKKSDTDGQFKKLAQIILEAEAAGVLVRLAVGSHNVESIAYVLALADELQLRDLLEVQMLRGMGDHISEAVTREGCRVRFYAPYGGLVPGIAYLVRRLLENTSQQSFLGINFLHPTEKGGKDV